MSEQGSEIPDQEANRLAVAKETLAACEWDLAREEERMSTVDGKLTALAGFAGVSLSITGGLGGSVLATSRLPAGLLIGLGSCFGVAVLLLLAGVIVAFAALSPKGYEGVKVTSVGKRIRQAKRNERTQTAALLSLALARAKALRRARKVNNGKARSAKRAFVLTAAGLGALVLGVLDVAVGSLL